MAEKRPAWFKFYGYVDEQLFASKDKDIATAIKAAAVYLNTGEIPSNVSGTGGAAMLFAHWKTLIDKSVEEYEVACAKAERMRDKRKAKSISKESAKTDVKISKESANYRSKKSEDRISEDILSSDTGENGSAFAGQPHSPSGEDEYELVTVKDPETGLVRHVKRRRGSDGAAH